MNDSETKTGAEPRKLGDVKIYIKKGGWGRGLRLMRPEGEANPVKGGAEAAVYGNFIKKLLTS